MIRYFPIVLVPLLFSGCSTVAPDIQRLSPSFQKAQPPAECRLVSVLPGSPAQRAGLAVGDVVKKVNGILPENASIVTDLVSKSSQDMTLEIVTAQGASKTLHVVLNNTLPRLGTVCDLTGWRKPGVSPAGNESITLFDGPCAVTVSGILDKQLVFLRVRITNHSDQPLQVGPDLFSAKDGRGRPMPILSPVQVLCTLYGDKGPLLLNRYQKNRMAVDNDTAPGSNTQSVEASCEGLPVVGRLASANAEYVEANAKYIAGESLWPKRLDSGATADGLIYMNEPMARPIQISAKVGSNLFETSLDLPKASVVVMKSDDLVSTLENMKKGTPLRVTLKTGKVFVGKFSSYDTLEEKAWFDAPTGFFTTTSFPLRSIKSVELVDK